MRYVIQKRKIIVLMIGVLFFTSFPSFGKDLIYNSKFFRAAEMVNNVSEDKAYIHLLLREDREFDIKLIYSERPDLSDPRTVVYRRKSNSKKNILIPLTNLKEGKRFFYQIYYQIYCREERGWEKATPIRNFATLKGNLNKGDMLKVILVGDLHTFDDADLGNKIVNSEGWRKLRLSGDYVNIFLERLFRNPFWTPKPGSVESKLMEGFCWAKAMKQILEEDPSNFLFDLGDLTGIGANYKWNGLGLSKEYAEKNYEEISKILWERTRRIYSGLSPYLPIYLVPGNHDGEENWNPAKFAAKKWKKKIFPMPKFGTNFEGDFSDGNYYAFTCGKNPNGTGGALFVVLDVCTYSGANNSQPKKLEEWTLGENQFQWLERVLERSRAKYKFILFHHVLGGWPCGSSESETNYCYGRGPLFTEDDYRLIGVIDQSKIEQIKLTELARKYNVNMFIYGHDHIFHLRSIGKNAKGDEMYALCVGSPKYQHDKRWWEEMLWQMFYGYAYRIPTPPFYGVPGYAVLNITKDRLEIKFVCSAYAPYPELNNFPARPGDLLFSKELYFH